MKKIAAVSVATIGGILIAGVISFLGLMMGSIIGERILGNKEPMLETLLGGVYGIALGVAFGIYGGRSCYRAIMQRV